MQDWKLQAPCRAADPAAFDVPPISDAAGWERLRVTAETWCRGCPFLEQCAADPAGTEGLWGGAARWFDSGKTRSRRLIPSAPEPVFGRGPRPSFASWVAAQGSKWAS